MKERIVRSAVESMQEHGVRGTTTKVVARRAGVSEGSIYNHFANRSALIVEAFGAMTAGIRRHAASLGSLAGTGTVEQNLVSLMESVMEFFREIAPVVSSVIGDPELRAWFSEGRVTDDDGSPLTPRTGVDELSDYLASEHRLGRLPERPSWTACATMLIGACMQYVNLELLTPIGLSDSAADSGEAVHTFSRSVVRSLFGDTRNTP